MENKAINWDDIMTESEFLIATKLLEIYRSGNYADLGKGLEALLEGSKVNSELELLDYIKPIMENLLLWKADEQFRTQERLEKTSRLQGDLELHLELDGYISVTHIEQEWDDSIAFATMQAKLFAPDYVFEELSIKEVLDFNFRNYGKEREKAAK